ncbi:MAG: hypothetical protein NC211_03890 [Alistipes senegalensis]|nr:hypothetical protein [Alistipes senegalensis]
MSNTKFFPYTKGGISCASIFHIRADTQIKADVCWLARLFFWFELRSCASVSSWMIFAISAPMKHPFFVGLAYVPHIFWLSMHVIGR